MKKTGDLFHEFSESVEFCSHRPLSSQFSSADIRGCVKGAEKCRHSSVSMFWNQFPSSLQDIKVDYVQVYNAQKITKMPLKMSQICDKNTLEGRKTRIPALTAIFYKLIEISRVFYLTSFTLRICHNFT